MVKLKPHIEAAGTQIVVVTMGQPEETERFCGERAPGVRCFCDPEATSYRAYGLTRGNTDQLFGPAVWLKGAQAALGGKFEGLPIGKPVGDPFQMPGVFVIGEDGSVSFAYYSKHAGDYPDDAELLRAVGADGQRQTT